MNANFSRDEHFVSTKEGKFLDQLMSDYQLLRKGSDSWSMICNYVHMLEELEEEFVLKY
jgi:hypothetical protein